MRPPRYLIPVVLSLFPPCTLSAAPGDADNDGLRDAVETNTGIFVSSENTGTNPNIADSDGDSMPDGMEVSLGTNPNSPSSRIKRPNIIYIVADDLGYGDVGCFWQNQKAGTMKFATPGLDSMAAQGAMLTNHYASAAICAASRCSLLQGRSQGHADIRDGLFDFPLPTRYSLASTLKASGYRTVHIGKAGLAGKDSRNPSAHPLSRGFERFFGFLTHTEAHEHYPRNGTTEKAAMVCDDYRFINDAYPDMFTGDLFTAFAKKEIIESATNRPDKPFFIYLAYDTPHFLNQYPPTATYPTGLGVSGGVQWTGAPSYVNTAVNDPNRVNNPANMHPSVFSSWYPAAQSYVSMIRRLDDGVSDILQTLRDLGIDKDTLVVFTSDNGPEPIGIYPPSFESYGPFEGTKADLLEGGIRVPTIAWWPGTLQGSNQLSNIRKIDRPCANYDWLATFTDMAKAPVPSFTDGTSLLPTLSGSGTQMNKGFLLFEMYAYGNTSSYPEFAYHAGQARYQMQAIRMGDFKGLRINITNGTEPFKIYNLTTDPKESIDLAASRPDLQASMKRLALGARRPITNTTRPYETTPIPAFVPGTPVRAGLKCRSYEGYWPWLPEFRSLTPVASTDLASIDTAARTRDQDFGLSFEGYLSIPSAGAYNFQVNSDSGCSLWLHESHVLDNEVDYAATKTSGAVYLSAGLHPLRLFYRHQTGTPSLALSYSGPGFAMQPVPATSYFVDGQPTILQPDTAVTKRGTPVTSDVLANDTAQNTLVLQSTSTPQEGISDIVEGKARYTPAAGYIGFDQFSYTVNDGITQVSSTVSATVLFDNETWLPLDEGNDVSVNAYGTPAPVTGSLSGAEDPSLSWTTGKLGKALKFDGTDDQVVFPNLPLPEADSPRSFSCWLKTSNTSLDENQTIFTYGPASGGQRFTVRLASGASAGSLVAVVDALPGSVTGTKTLNDGKWHHLALVAADHDDNDVTDIAETKLYVDGQPDTVSSSNPALLTTSMGTSACLGGSDQSTACNYNGNLDDVRIFPRALSGSEIQELYQATLSTAVMTGMPLNDSDNDGIPDQAEMVAGTDPDDPASLFKIGSHSTSSDGAITLEWAGVAGRSYRVEESSNLKDWTLVNGVAPVVVTANTPNASLTVPANGTPKRFVRLQVQLTP